MAANLCRTSNGSKAAQWRKFSFTAGIYYNIIEFKTEHYLPVIPL
jgi:hypothetical protein